MKKKQSGKSGHRMTTVQGLHVWDPTEIARVMLLLQVISGPGTPFPGCTDGGSEAT